MLNIIITVLTFLKLWEPGNEIIPVKRHTIKEFSKSITLAMINNILFKDDFIDSLNNELIPFSIDTNLDTIKIDGKTYLAALISHVGLPIKDISERKSIQYSTLVIFNKEETYVQMIKTEPLRWYSYLKSLRRNKEEFMNTIDDSFYPLRADTPVLDRNLSQYVYGLS